MEQPRRRKRNYNRHKRFRRNFETAEPLQSPEQSTKQISFPSEPIAPNSSITSETLESASEKTQVPTQNQSENSLLESTSAPNLSTPDKDQTPAERERVPASGGVLYTLNYSKRDGVSRHMRSMKEREFREVKEYAAQSAFEVKKNVQMFDDHPAKMDDGDRIQFVLGEQIFIYSPHLLEAVREVIRYWPTIEFFNSISNKRLELTSPYTALGANSDGFKKYVAEKKAEVTSLERFEQSESNTVEIDEKKTTISEVEQLMKEVNQHYDPLLKQAEILRKRDDPMVTFDMLCLLFRPGQFVYAKISGSEIACMVQALVWPAKEIDDDPSVCVILYLWYLDFNGSEIDRRCHQVSIMRFKGEHIIRELDAYPEEYAKNSAAKREELEKRGKTYFSLLADTASYRSYKGTISTDSDDPYNKKNQRWYEGKVIIDPARYVRENGTSIEQSEWQDDTDTRWTQDGEKYKSFVKIDPKDLKLELKKDHYFLTPCHIRAFTLDARDQREWVFLEIDKIEPYKQKKELIHSLKIDTEDIKMIKAVAQPRRHRSQNSTEDKVPGKGEGDIILLYGPSGTGKTYTAECIAEWSGRPLLRLTCTELGVNPNELEAKLFIFFQRAEEWNAIVLMDECDVYLSRRSPQSALEKNAVVAIFLRALDYFKGTLFLTTNHSFMIDRAIIDRLSLTVEYQKSKEVRKKLCAELKSRLNRSGYSLSEAVEKELEEIYADKDECAVHKDKCVDKDKCAGKDKCKWSGREINTVFNLVTKRTDFDSTEDASREIDSKIVATVMKRVKDFDSAWEKAHNQDTMDASLRKMGVA